MVRDAGIDLAKLRGKSVLIKPNWVRHNLKEHDKWCLTTHPNFILAIVQIVLENQPAKVIIADAPVQGCDWNALVTDTFKKHIYDLSERYRIPISIIDFRRTIFNGKMSSFQEEIRDLSKYVIFDMAEKSYLEPITTETPLFRVTNYDPRRLAQSHKKGKHLYCIAKELFEADYIIALPKAKTHQKAGITNALKLLVGFNGDKDFLPHHRFGSTKQGGDCYPGKNFMMHMAEIISDKANHKISSPTYRPLSLLVKMICRLSRPSAEQNLSAGWYGNDTTWRMVMDLNKIAINGKPDGTLSDKQERSILYICDGIIGGQGNGPLRPEPLPLGIIMISENATIMDKTLAILMGFDNRKFPLLNASEDLFPTANTSVYLNGHEVSSDELNTAAISTKAPKGWANYLNSKEK